MPKQRFDNKPMNRVAQAAGDDKAVLLKQETDPTNMLELNRRHGSVRVDDKSKALGVVVDGDDAQSGWFSTQKLTASASWSIGFSLKVGQHLDSDATNKLPILTVQKDENNFWEFFSVYNNATTCTLKIGATMGGTAVTAVALDAAKAKDAVVNVVLTYNDTGDKFIVHSSTDAAEELTAAPTASHEFTVEVLGNSHNSTAKNTHVPHVVSNLTVYTGVLDATAAGNLYADRTPATSNLQNHYLLSSGGQAVSSEVDGDTDMLLCNPSPPVAAADSLVFNGKSSALRVQMTQHIEHFFTSKSRAALYSNEYTFYLKGKLLEDGAQTLLDFDDLGVLTTDADGDLIFTVGGTSHRFDNAQLTRSNPDFEIFAIKSAEGTLLIVHDGDKESAATDITGNPPYFDMSNPPKLWVGSAAAEDGTKYCGTLTKFAMYKGTVTTDLGPTEDALVYLEGASFIDKSNHNTGVYGVAKTARTGSCSYTDGPLDDASYVAIAGGHVVGEGDIVGLTKGTKRMMHAFKKDAEVLRVGSKLLIASNDVGHVVDEEAESIREYGVPTPWRNVSVKGTAPGVLEGAASYGYRFVTSDGTYGPIRRLDPAYINGTAGRFIVGSSIAADGGISELGETFIKTSKGGHLTAGADSTTTDIFGTVTDNKRMVIECFAKVEELDMDELPETIWGRGLQSTESNSASGWGGGNLGGRRRQFWRSGTFQIDLDDDFTIQTSFKYKEKAGSGSVGYDRTAGSDYTYSGFYPAQGVFALGRFHVAHGRTQHNRHSCYNPSICAYLLDGNDVSASLWQAGEWFHRHLADNSGTISNVYGKGDAYNDTSESGKGSPRLVIGIAREQFEHWHQFRSENQWGPQSNMKWITFTDASELVAGSGNDESIWKHEHDYSLFVVRETNALKVYVHDATDEKWYILKGRYAGHESGAMTALRVGKDGHGGSTSSTYTDTDFFEGWTNPHPLDQMQMLVKSIGDWAYFVNPIGPNGQPTTNVRFGYYGTGGTYDNPLTMVHGTGGSDDNLRVMCNHEVCPMEPETVVFHARVWSEGIDEIVLRENAHLRFAAREEADGSGGALRSGNVVDAHFSWPDNAEEKDSFPDSKHGGMLWKSRYSRTGDQKCKIFEQEVTHADLKRQPIMMIGNRASSLGITTAPLVLYYSNRGKGSLTLQTMGKAAYIISNEEIPGGGTDTHFARMSDFEFVNDFHEWNMFTIQVRVKEIGGAATLYIEGMAINGNTVFDVPISEPGAAWTEADNTDWITLGGTGDSDATNNEMDVYVGEFRIWADGQGPKVPTGEPGPNGWNVSNRVTSDDLGKLVAYYRMTKQDLATGSNVELENQGTATGYDQMSTLTLDDASILQDDRDPEAGTNAVAFPAPARPDIAAIELFRTITQGIIDLDIEDDVQKALDSVRYAPLYFVARIPADTRHYLDDAPNSALGFAAPWTEYSIPDQIKQFFTWQGQVGVIGDSNRVYYTEPGPFGWETFPYDLVYEARVSGGGAGDLLACRSTGDTLYLFGRSWTTALIGAPGNETEIPLGGGVGAYSPRATLEMSGQVYAFNGRLWVMDRVGQVDFKVQDVGTPFQDLLPTHSNVRLACSTNLQSVFIIDENTGDTLRMFIPTGEVTVEKRYALAVGDSGDGTDQWVNVSGSYSTGNTSVYGDDVDTDTTVSSAGTLSTSNSRFDCSSTIAGVNVGLRVGIVDASGNTLDTTVTGVAGNNVTVASVSGLGTDSAGTIYFGASVEGMIVDSGYIDTGAESSMINETQISIQSGSGVEVGFAGSPMAGTRTSIADAQFVTVAVNDTTVGGDVRGRFLRGILRNRKPEATAISHVDIDITIPNAQ